MNIIQDDEAARSIVELRLDVKIFEPFSGLIFYDEKGTTGAAIFNNYDGRDVHFTACSIGIGIHHDREFSSEIAKYVFEHLGCHRCTAVTRRSNIRAIKALERLGFVREGVLREHFNNNEDGIIYGILESEQRWKSNGLDPVSASSHSTAASSGAGPIRYGSGPTGIQYQFGGRAEPAQ